MYLFNFHVLGRHKFIEAILEPVSGRDTVGREGLRSGISTIGSWLRLLRFRWFKSLQWGWRKHLLFAWRKRILLGWSEAAGRSWG